MKAPQKWLSKFESLRVWRAWFRYKARSTSRYTPHQGYRECARRRGEIGWQAKQS